MSFLVLTLWPCHPFKIINGLLEPIIKMQSAPSYYNCICKLSHQDPLLHCINVLLCHSPWCPYFLRSPLSMYKLTVCWHTIPVNNFLLETHSFHLETHFNNKYRGLIESFVTWCNNNHLVLNISKSNKLVVVDYQRNRRPPVLDVIQGEVKCVDPYSIKYWTGLTTLKPS